MSGISNTITTYNHYQLSYNDMINICYPKHYRFFHDEVIHHYIPSRVGLVEEWRDLPEDRTGNSSLIRSPPVIVIAYLVSNNNIDYLISILAAIAHSATGSTTPDRRRMQYQLLPVLIPTKWTVSEIVRVLQIPPPTTRTRTKSSSLSLTQQVPINQSNQPPHITILVHDQHHESMAHQVQQQLLQQNQSHFKTESSSSAPAAAPPAASTFTQSTKTTTTSRLGEDNKQHIVQCVVLPNYAHDCIIINHGRNTKRHTDPNTICGKRNTHPTIHRVVTGPMDHPLDSRAQYYSYDHSNGHDNVKHPITDVQQISDATAIIVFTSGTGSGIAKGVCISHRAMYVQCQMKQAACAWSNTTKLVFGMTVPIYHIGGIINYYATWYCGGTLILPLLLPVVTSPPSDALHILQSSSPPPPPQISFDPYIIFQSITSPQHGNTLVVVPTMLHAMQIYYEQTQSMHQQQQQQQYAHVQCILIGGQSANPNVLHFLQQIFPSAQMIQTYACTEATSSLTYHRIPNNSNHTTTRTTTTSTTTKLAPMNVEENGTTSIIQKIGQCVGVSPCPPIIEIMLWKDPTTTVDGNHYHRGPPIIITAPLTPGVIVTRGPHIMNGYWNLRGRQSDNTSSSSSFDNSEYFITNDIGFWSENQQLYYIGRLNTDTIRTGGETVWCTEVEQIIQQHPQIQECTVFGIPDYNYYGEVVCCAIVPTATVRNDDINIQQIRSYCAQHGLAGYKRPRHLLVYTATRHQDDSTIQPSHPKSSTLLLLPRNSNGKILKYQLQEKMNESIQQNRHRNDDKNKSNAMTTFIVYVDTTNVNNTTNTTSSQLQSKL
jgi:acyl-CoA synthetase (AMP-forming)/AMP-acid ligase II